MIDDCGVCDGENYCEDRTISLTQSQIDEIYNFNNTFINNNNNNNYSLIRELLDCIYCAYEFHTEQSVVS